MAAQDILGDNLGDEFVTVYVGPKRKEYTVHKKVICDTAEYFSKAFTGAFKERDGVIYLPEERTEAFGLFVDWLYRGTVPLVASQHHLERLFHLYVFAERLCMEQLANKTMDKIWEMCTLYAAAKTTPPMVASVFRSTFVDSPLRKWALEDLAHGLDLNNGSGIPDDETSEAFRELCKESDNFFEAYLRHMRANVIDGLPDPRESESLCDYHRHGRGEVCYLGASDATNTMIWMA